MQRSESRRGGGGAGAGAGPGAGFDTLSYNPSQWARAGRVAKELFAEAGEHLQVRLLCSVRGCVQLRRTLLSTCCGFRPAARYPAPVKRLPLWARCARSAVSYKGSVCTLPEPLPATCTACPAPRRAAARLRPAPWQHRACLPASTAGTGVGGGCSRWAASRPVPSIVGLVSSCSRRVEGGACCRPS